MEEIDVWKKGKRKREYYRDFLEKTSKNPLSLVGKAEMEKVIHPEEMPWEVCEQGLIKHLVNKSLCEELNFPAKSVNVYMQIIPPGGRSGKHRHMSEEILFVLEGEGYDLHWDVDIEIREDKRYWKIRKEPKRFEWKDGDAIYIPTNTVHQHFNSSMEKRVRLISATSRVYDSLGFGYNDLEQFESAMPSKEELEKLLQAYACNL